MLCTRCDGTGFINWDDRLPKHVYELEADKVLEYISNFFGLEDTDMSVCDCCGNGESWYGEPGSHNPNDAEEMANCGGNIDCQ